MAVLYRRERYSYLKRRLLFIYFLIQVKRRTILLLFYKLFRFYLRNRRPSHHRQPAGVLCYKNHDVPFSVWRRNQTETRN